MPDRSPFSRDPLTVPIGGERVIVPYHSAADWVNAVQARLGPGGVLLSLVRETTRQILRDAMVAGDLEAEQMIEASHKLTELATGWKWWKATRLLLASGSPQILGRVVVKGMDPWSLTPAMWCAGVYELCTAGADDLGKAKFDAQLSVVPAGEEDDDLGDDFEIMVAQVRQMPGMK